MSSQGPSTSSGAGAISFKLNNSKATSSGGRDKPVKSYFDDEENENFDKDYLTSVEEKELKSVRSRNDKRDYIIPLIKSNKWRDPSSGRINRNDKLQENEGEISEIDQMAVDAILNDAAAGTLFNDEEKIESGQGNKGLIIPLLMQNKPPVKFEKDKLNDIPLRPDQSTMDDYDEMPVGHFGSAILKGMGWAPGQSIGLNKKGLTDLVEFIPHPGGLGMGATPRPMKNNKNKIKKPGEINVKRPKPYKDKDGKIKHVKKIDEVIPEQIPEGFHVGNQAVVTDGPHKGLYGKITSLDDDSVTLKLRINGQSIKFKYQNLQLVSKGEYDMKQPHSGQYGLIKSKKSKREENEMKMTSSSKRYKHNDNDSTSWLHSNLRVRIIDKGPYYNHKVDIIDVIDRHSCVCRTDEGTLLDDIDERMIETVIPRNVNSVVMIVKDKYKGELAVIVERHKRKCEAVVKLVQSHEILTIDFDSICEFIGDVEQFK